MSSIDVLKPEQVKDGPSYCRYAQQELGLPYPTGKNIAALNKAVKEYFKNNPDADWVTLTKVIKWAKDNSRRYATPITLLNNGLPKAFQAGYLPELDPSARGNWDEKIAEALRNEDDEAWRDRLIRSQGHVRIEIYEQWLEERGSNV